MKERVERILNMVKDGKLSPEEAETLINSIDKKKEGKDEHYLRIRVIESSSKKENPTVVKVNLPLKVVKLLVKSTGKIGLDAVMKNKKVKSSLSGYGLETDDTGKIADVEAFVEALDALCENAPIELVNVVDNDDEKGENTVVKITIE